MAAICTWKIQFTKAALDSDNLARHITPSAINTHSLVQEDEDEKSPPQTVQHQEEHVVQRPHAPHGWVNFPSDGMAYLKSVYFTAKVQLQEKHTCWELKGSICHLLLELLSELLSERLSELLSELPDKCDIMLHVLS